MTKRWCVEQPGTDRIGETGEEQCVSGLKRAMDSPRVRCVAPFHVAYGQRPG